uniref:Uncharacterized protein n=1 Tax=Anguilla anguilla TaxID=7936 RepID=A0A0E9UWD1_ANGAN
MRFLLRCTDGTPAMERHHAVPVLETRRNWDKCS